MLGAAKNDWATVVVRFSVVFYKNIGLGRSECDFSIVEEQMKIKSNVKHITRKYGIVQQDCLFS